MDKFLVRTPRKDMPQETDSPETKRMKFDDTETVEDIKAESSSNLASSVSPKNSTEECRFGRRCFRRNIHHFKEYRHPHLEDLLEIMSALDDYSQIPAEYGSDSDKSVTLEQIQVLRALRKSRDQNVDNLSLTHASESERPKLEDGNYEHQAKYAKAEDRSREFKQSFGESESNEKAGNTSMTPLAKWEAAAPFHLFLTSIGPEQTFFSLSYTDLFHSSFGEVKSVCHINFMVDVEWLMDRITMSSLWGTPLTIVHGTDNPDVPRAATEFDWIQAYRMKAPHPFGHHHTKMSLIEYSDQSLRVLVYTANLIEGDWLNKTQGIWVSPKCSKIVNKEDLPKGESPTGFRNDLIAYLLTYHLKAFDEWISKIQTADMSDIKVVFVAAAPNINKGLTSNGFRWGVKKVETVLKKHQTAPVNSKWPIISQCSSIGSLGPDISWLQNEWASFFEGPVKSKPSVKLVYPSCDDVRNSADGIDGADCLPYSNIVHSKQMWLEQIMCKWVSFRYNRTYAMPHVKTYCRVSPDCKQMAWFILTSANLSKAAWGKLNKKRDQLQVMSWEAGVMFLPKFFNCGPSFEGEISPIDNGSRASSRIATDRGTVGYPFPVPYDLPIHPYSPETQPWLCDYLNRPRR